MWLADVALAVLACVGHAALWIAVVNHVHATAMPCWLVRGLTACGYALVLLGPLAWGASLGLPSVDRAVGPLWSRAGAGVAAYVAVCWAVAAGPVVWWVWRRLTARPPAVLKANHTAARDLRALEGQAAPRGPWRWMVRLPRNEVLWLDVNEKTLEIPRLSPALEGLAIVHLSDLHFTGRIGKAYFQEAIRLANGLEPDLVALTGDLVENAACLAWIPDTLGRIKSRYGAYFVLGNHDTRVNLVRLREALVAAGLVDLGGRWQQIEVHARPVLLAGNELPWIVPAADLRDCPAAPAGEHRLRILLAHTPDQFRWARQHDFDLLLAGHTHGGQIAIPPLGAIVAPSRHGVKYASGAFHEPPTVMHVSRGVSSELPLRWNCRPELARLVLRGRPC